MKLTEIHDTEPLVLHLLRKLLKDPQALILAEFHFTDADPSVPVEGALYAIHQKMHGIYEFSITDSHAIPDHYTFTDEMVERMDLKKGKVDSAGHQLWELSYRDAVTEGVDDDEGEKPLIVILARKLFAKGEKLYYSGRVQDYGMDGKMTGHIQDVWMDRGKLKAVIHYTKRDGNGTEGSSPILLGDPDDFTITKTKNGWTLE
jgi:hypothetical protein